MSEYQYYEFLAIDRPLTTKETDSLRELSTRARITPVSFINHYNWGDFKGNPENLMQKYFDAHVYVANWMTAIFMVRLPIDALSGKTIDAFKVPYMMDFKKTKTHWIITWFLEESEDYDRFAMENGEGWMARLAPIRDELLSGDIRSLYIGWLAAVNCGSIDEDQMEPVSLSGLRDFTSPQLALAEFLEVDPDLLKGVGSGREECRNKTVSRKQKMNWVQNLPEKEIREIIRQIIDDKGSQTVRDVKRRFLSWLRHQRDISDKPPLRTVGVLWENSKKAEKKRIEQENRKRKQQEIQRRKKREAYLVNLSKNFPKMWRSIDQTVRRGSGLAYDEACRTIIDIFDAHNLTGTQNNFKKQIKQFMSGHTRRKALIKRLVKAGLWKDA